VQQQLSSTREAVQRAMRRKCSIHVLNQFIDKKLELYATLLPPNFQVHRHTTVDTRRYIITLTSLLRPVVRTPPHDVCESYNRRIRNVRPLTEATVAATCTRLQLAAGDAAPSVESRCSECTSLMCSFVRWYGLLPPPTRQVASLRNSHSGNK